MRHDMSYALNIDKVRRRLAHRGAQKLRYRADDGYQRTRPTAGATAKRWQRYVDQ